MAKKKSKNLWWVLGGIAIFILIVGGFGIFTGLGGDTRISENTKNQIISNSIIEIDKVLDMPYNKQGEINTQSGCTQYIGTFCIRKSTIHYVTFDVNGGGDVQINTKRNSVNIEPDSLRINLILNQAIDFNPRYIENLCNLPSLNSFDSFIEDNTKLSLAGIEKYIDIEHNDLRDSSENIVAIQYGSNYDYNADGNVDKVKDFYCGYTNQDNSIKLLYSLTNSDVKYVTIRSANGINYVTSNGWELTTTGSNLEIRRFSGFQSGQKTYPEKCEKYYLLPKEEIFGIPCDDDYQCRHSCVALSGTCNLNTGKCNYGV